MKRNIFMLMAVFMLPLALYSQQVVYSYDAAGNRISSTLSSGSQAPILTGIDAIEGNSEQAIHVGPNPTSNLLYIRLSQWNDSDKCHLLLSNLAGQTLAEQPVNSVRTELNLGALPTGYYLLQVVLNNQATTYKILKK